MAPLVICGLGNPGDEYRATRHNAGFRVAEFLSEEFGGRWSYPSPRYSLSRIRLEGEDALIVRPTTYMNLSGDAVRDVVDTVHVPLGRLLVVCDDIALPAGRVRLRRRGSDGGHNGMKSIIDRLSTRDFPRLRLGVGAPPDGVDAADYVLEPVGEDDEALLRKMVRHAARCVRTWAGEGIGVAMARFNERGRVPGDETG